METEVQGDNRLDRIESILEGLLSPGESAKPREQEEHEEFECDNCGARVMEGVTYCPHCGSALQW